MSNSIQCINSKMQDRRIINYVNIWVSTGHWDTVAHLENPYEKETKFEKKT